MHGDLLCTEDTLYQIYRKIAHNPFIKAVFLKLPLAYRLSIVQKLRTQPKKSYKIDKTTVGILNALPYLKKYDASILIHGHVHYAATHIYSDKDHSYQHWIMPDWREHEGNYLVFSDNQPSLNGV
jgi:UDP-2,3-diacylglucosamine hydrolase